MASIERTAYPRFGSHTIKIRELEKFYTLTKKECDYIWKNIRGNNLRINFAVQLKVFQHLHYFPDLSAIPKEIITHIKKCLSLSNKDYKLEYKHASALYRHRSRIREYVKVVRWGKLDNPISGQPINPAQHHAVRVAYRAAQTMNNPADIINSVIENLINQHYE